MLVVCRQEEELAQSLRRKMDREVSEAHHSIRRPSKKKNNERLDALKPASIIDEYVPFKTWKQIPRSGSGRLKDLDSGLFRLAKHSGKTSFEKRNSAGR